MKNLIVLFLVMCVSAWSATLEGVRQSGSFAYSVKRGDSLWKLSRYFYGTASRVDLLKKYNKLKGDDLFIGQRLRIPELFLLVRVESGDTLSKISEKYYCGVSRYKTLAKVNGLKDSGKIHLGQMLKVPLYKIKQYSPCKSQIRYSGAIRSSVSVNCSDVSERCGSAGKAPFVKKSRVIQRPVVVRSSQELFEQPKTTSYERSLRFEDLIARKRMELMDDPDFQGKSSARMAWEKTLSGSEPVLERPSNIVSVLLETPSEQKNDALMTQNVSDTTEMNEPKTAAKFFTEAAEDVKDTVSKIHKATEKALPPADTEKTKGTFAVGFDSYNFTPKTQDFGLGPVGDGSLPVIRLTRGMDSMDLSFLMGTWESSSFDNNRLSTQRNSYSFQAVTAATERQIHKNASLRAEIGVARYTHDIEYEDLMLPPYKSSSRDFDMLASLGVSFDLGAGFEVMMKWTSFGGTFEHSAPLGASSSGFEVDMGASEFGFGFQYRF
jgi:LysM repeat protein